MNQCDHGGFIIKHLTIIILAITAVGAVLYAVLPLGNGTDDRQAAEQSGNNLAGDAETDPFHRRSALDHLFDKPAQKKADDSDSGKKHAEKVAGQNGVDDMNLDEKIGQMIFSGVDGTEMTEETKRIIATYHVGGVILFGDNIASTTQTVDFLNDMKAANAGNPQPLLLGVDEEGGSVTRMPDGVTSLPSNRSIGKMSDPDLSFRVGKLLGEQMKTLGFNLDFAPVLDVDSNPDNPVIGDRSFGADPELVTQLGIETMKGIEEKGIIPVIKHFPGHGDTGEDSHLQLPRVDKSRADLSEVELVPFRKAISEGADVSMIAHILLPAIDEQHPASMSRDVITDMLRDDLDFDGVVITDDLTMEAITDHYSVADAVIQTVKAGGDMMLVAHDPGLIKSVFDKLKAAVENGDISEDRIDESVERIVDLKNTYDISDVEAPEPDFERINEQVEAVLEEIS